MASSFNIGQGKADSGGQFAARLSTHLAMALIAFSVLQIIIVAKMGGAIGLHLGIICSIALFALAARRLEHGWRSMIGEAKPSEALKSRFSVDLLQIWCVSLAAPFLWIPVVLAVRALIG